MDSTNLDEKGFLTEAVMIKSLKKQRNDPRLHASLQDVCRGFLDAMLTNEEGYLQRAEFRRAFESLGMCTTDSCFAEPAFNAIDSNHDGKLSFDETIQVVAEFLLSDDRDLKYNLLLGPLI